MSRGESYSFRSVGLALVSGLKVIFHRMGFDIWDLVAPLVREGRGPRRLVKA